MSSEKKKVHVRVIENITDTELNELIEGLKRIEGFNFSVDNFVIVNQSLSDRAS
jgi:hypothetical protein